MDESEAIRRCVSGDRDAFAVLVEAYQAIVLALCLRMTGNRADALDVSQLTFVKAWGALDRFDRHLPFRPWLLKIATNECISHLRRHRRQPVPMEQATLEYAAGPDESTSALQELLSDRERIRHAVSQLPDPYRTLVLRFYFQQQRYQEIAGELDLPVGTVATYLYRAKQMLAKILTEEEGDAHGPPEPRGASAVSRR